MLTYEVARELEGRELDAAIDEFIFGHAVKFLKGEPTGWAVKKQPDESEIRIPITWYPNDYIRTHSAKITLVPWYHNNWHMMEEMLLEAQRRGWFWKLSRSEGVDRYVVEMLHQRGHSMRHSHKEGPTAAARALLIGHIYLGMQDDNQGIRSKEERNPGDSSQLDAAGLPKEVDKALPN